MSKTKVVSTGHTHHPATGNAKSGAKPTHSPAYPKTALQKSSKSCK